MHASICARFDVPGTLSGCRAFGSGLINDTFLCEFSGGESVRKYILQRINRTVFTMPDLVMRNVASVTAHLQERLRAEGVADPWNETPALVATKDGGTFHRDGSGEYWRLFHFIETGEVFDTVRSEQHAFEVGRCLGRFQTLLSDLPADSLHDTLPGFHDTPAYLERLFGAAGTADADRLAAAQAEIAFAEQRTELAPLLLVALRAGSIPLRVVHNDPKVNNVLVHRETGRAICMLDLDTVKPGIVHFDFGDCVRSAANRAGEDAQRPEDAVLDLDLYRAISSGYVQEARAFLTPAEISLLPASVKVITFELGIRFLEDHLRGDVYFKTSAPGHNLHRARVQFRLLESIEAQEHRMALS